MFFVSASLLAEHPDARESVAMGVMEKENQDKVLHALVGGSISSLIGSAFP
jgi:hypothetical protein